MKTLKVHLAPYYLICFCLPAFSPAGHALPAMPVTEQGSASVSISGNRMDITQHSDLLISRHSQYDVGAAESVVYLQPSSSALAIAKIDGGMSQILGHISANGRLWLVNANGFFVGQNASLDTAGLMLASHSLQQDGAGFSLQQGPGSITNLGSITVQGDGQLTLLSRQVDNQGQLSSGGDLLINTGERLLLQPKGQGFAVEVQQNSNAGQISNSGDMQGHYVALNADRNISSAEITINNTGNISAVAVLENNGEVYLSARGGDVIQDGTVQAAGGLIDIHADTYLQQGQLDASAAPGQNANGGMVNLWADKGFELSGSSRIAANASGYGNGGQLNLISPGYALLHSGGWLSARGGELGGNGGFAELSGWQFVLSNGLADMRAPKGTAGTYLIDPYNIEIIAGSTDTNTAFGAGSYTASNTPAQIGADNITTQLGLGNVTISTAGAGGEAGDITITGAVDLTGSNGNTLTFTADGSIAINNDLTNTADSTNISMTAGGNITFSAGSQIDAGAGTISLTSGGSTQLRSGSLQTTSASNTAISVTTTNNLTGSTDDSADIIATNGGISLTAGAISSLELNVKKAGFNTSGVSGVSVRVQGDMELTALSLAASAPLGILGFSTNSNRMGTLTLPTTGITVSGALNLYTADILDGDGGDVIINNSSATSIQLNNPAAARSFELGIGNTGLTVGNAQGLTAKNSTGNLQVSGTLSGGNLTLNTSGNMQISSLSGAASLNASATGSITIPDAGLSTTSAITLNGTDIIDSTAPRAITLNTSSLNVTTALAGGDTSISTTATSLAVNKGTATGLLSVNKSNAGNLTVSTVDSGDGDLSLNLTNGDLIVSDTHLQTTGTLTVVANDIHDSDRIVTLNGTLLDITLNGTNINGLTLRGLANTSVAIAGTSATDLTLLSDSGSFTVTSMGNWAGAVTLDAFNRITVPDAGISSDSTLTVNAGYVRSASSGTSATLNGGFGLVLDLGLGNGSATVNTTSLFGAITTSGTSNTLTLNKTDAGDFDLGSASISGGLNIALNNGTLSLPASITVPGTLTLNANDLNDTTINGGTLDLSLDALADALTLNTALDNATINISGAAQDFVLTETDDLNLSSFTSTGNVNITTAGALTIADTGLSSSGALTLDVGDIHDSDRSVILNGSTGLTISTDLSGGNSTVNTTNSSASLSTTSANTLTLNKTDAGNFTLNSASITAGGLNIALTDGTLTLPGTITVPGTFTINANDLNDTTINGGTLALSLDALADALTLNTALDNAAINISGATQDFVLTETDDLNLSSFTSTGNVNITSGGALTIADTGLSSSGVLTLDVADIHDSDRSVILNAGLGLDLTTSLSGGDSTVNITNNNVILHTSGTSNTLRVNKTNAGDLDLFSASISGGLNLQLSNGTLNLPASVTVPGTFTINAHDVLEGDINGGTLNLTLDALADALTLNTALSNATINISGAAQNFVLNETDDLNLSSFASTGNVSITTGGALTIADAGLSSSGALTLDVGDIHDADRSVILNGSTGLTLSTDLSGGNSTVNTTNSSAAISTTSANTLTLNKTDAGNFTLNSASIAAGGLNIALNNGTLTLPASITVPGTLTVNAHDLSDGTINGGTLDLTLDALADALTLTTSLSSAAINISGAAQGFILNESDALTLSSLNSSGDAAITTGGTLGASGTLTCAGLCSINSAGLSTDLSVSSADFLLVDSGNNQTRSITSDAQNNDVTFSGSNNALTLNLAANGHLADLNSDNLAINITDGHATLNFAGAGFIDSALNIADDGNDGNRHGWLNIVYGGALDINADIDVLSTFETSTTGLPKDASNSYAGLLVLENQGSGTLTLAAGTQLSSTGGDIVLDILGTEGNYSAMVMGSGSAINALNTPADSTTAIDSAAPYASQLLAASGRTIYLLPDASNPPITPGPDINDVIDEALSGAEETQIQDQPAGNSAAEEIISSTQESLDNNPNISFAMETIFNRCTRQNSDKCELKKELSRFLGQYLIGGSMPKAKK